MHNNREWVGDDVGAEGDGWAEDIEKGKEEEEEQEKDVGRE